MIRTPQHGQADVEDKILEVLEHGGEMETQQINRLVRAGLGLLPGDFQPAKERPNEQVIDQIIANALQAQRPLCARHLIERVARGRFRLTNEGRTYLANQRQNVSELSALLPDDL